MERAEFERLRERHVQRLEEDLKEAANLLCQLNKNLELCGERTGDTERLSQVWAQFQNRMVVLSQALMTARGPSPV